MGAGELTYNDFLSRLSIQDVLLDAGYYVNRRDGLRYPSDVRLDSDGCCARGDFESNSFVVAVTDHIRKKSALGDATIALLDKVLR